MANHSNRGPAQTLERGTFVLVPPSALLGILNGFGVPEPGESQSRAVNRSAVVSGRVRVTRSGVT